LTTGCQPNLGLGKAVRRARGFFKTAMGGSSANPYPGYRGPPGKRNKQGLAWADANSLLPSMGTSASTSAPITTGSDGMEVPVPMATPLPVGPSCVLEVERAKPRRPSITPPVMRPLKFLTTTTTGDSVESDVVELEWRISNFVGKNPGVGGRLEGTPFNAGGHVWCDPPHCVAHPWTSV
jgi:hypothetical protein